MLTDLAHDFRFAARILWRNRGFAASAMLILALGIAASGPAVRKRRRVPRAANRVESRCMGSGD
jgi:hypothetical protein